MHAHGARLAPLGDVMGFLGNLPRFEAMPAAWQGHAVEVRSCPVRKGEVHYHHALVWHGSPANTSARERRAIALHYMTGETRYVEVAGGEVLEGGHFPLVWERTQAAAR